MELRDYCNLSLKYSSMYKDKETGHDNSEKMRRETWKDQCGSGNNRN